MQGSKDGFMTGWTVFYWGWWISWGPFVGTFLARISRGRKLGEMIIASLILPSLWGFLFLGIFGAAQIRIVNLAKAAGMTSFSDPTLIYGSQADPTKVGYWIQDATNATKQNWQPVYKGTTYLYALSTENVLFEHLCYYGGIEFSQHLTFLVLVCIVLYFVTSSDSASFVVDIMAANGVEEPPTLQKVFWGCTEGVAAVALVLAAGDGGESLEAVKILPIILGLPFTFLLFWMCQALIIVCKEEAGEWPLERRHFKVFLFNVEPMSWLSFLVPFVPLSQVGARVWGGKPLVYGLGYGFVWLLMIVYLFCGIGDVNNAILGGAMYICFGTAVSALRVGTRVKCGISGDMISDFCASTFFMPWAVGQMFAEDVEVAAEKAKAESI